MARTNLNGTKGTGQNVSRPRSVRGGGDNVIPGPSSPNKPAGMKGGDASRLVKGVK